MGVFDFLKKKEAPPTAEPQPSAPVPVDQVYSLKQQGYTNEQIVQYLQQQGFSYQQIYDAITQTETRAEAEPYASPPMAYEEVPAPQTAPKEGTEELVEKIIQEKWQELTRELGKFNEWKEKTDSRLDKIEQSISDIKGQMDNLQKAVVGRVSEYDKALLDVGTEIKAMEKVFQKVLPDLTTSVQELSRITKTVKKGKEEGS